MDFFIKKIFEGKSDELVHFQFQKFSKGEFKNKAMIKAKNYGSRFNIDTTYEYANELVKFFAEKLGGNKTKVIGMVVSTRDLTGELDFQNKKQFMGVKQYMIDKEMSGEDIIKLCDLLPNSFIGLSFKVGESELKIKPKAPKSAKPSTKREEKLKIDFCKIKTNDKEIINRLIFDKEAQNFKTIEVNHVFLINEIILPSGEKDFVKIREFAQKKGKIIRELNIDGKKIIKEIDFIA